MTTPAAMVSPPRRMSTRPISLFSAEVSSGMLGVLEEPCVGRSEISTVAVAPFCNTLRKCQSRPK